MSADSPTVVDRLEGDALLGYDAEHVFHMRYSTVEAVRHGVILKRGAGMMLETSDGRTLIDAISTHHNVNLGHCHPELSRAIYEQLQTLDHVVTVPGFTNEPLVNVTAAVLRHALPGMASVFYAVTGAEAVEATLKMARYYWKALGRDTKTRFLSLNLGYHGNSFATLAATGRDHDGVPSASGRPLFPMFGPLPDGYVHVLGPYDFHNGTRSPEEEANMGARALEEAIAGLGSETIAGFIYEPMQGHNFYAPHKDYYHRVREICDEHEILTIDDEMITGFGRSGDWWGMGFYAGAEPDLVAFGKGVTSGSVPLSGAIASDKVWEVIRGRAPSQPVEITGTYGGHPVLCAAAIRNIELIEEHAFIERACALGDHLRSQLAGAFDMPELFEVRGTGLTAAIEFRTGHDADALRQRIAMEAFGRDLVVRGEYGTVGPLVSITPPFVATEPQIDQIVAVLREAVDAALAAI
jgi:adenosylmethionine-8-amino-7-oxononanoate aminotransferase